MIVSRRHGVKVKKSSLSVSTGLSDSSEASRVAFALPFLADLGVSDRDERELKTNERNSLGTSFVFATLDGVPNQIVSVHRHTQRLVTHSS